MPRPITASRLDRVRTRARAARARVTDQRDRVLELVFSLGSSQFSLRTQRAIQGLVQKKADQPIVALVFASGRILFGERVKGAVARVIDAPSDVDAVIDLVFVFPTELVGPDNNKLSPFMEALADLGVDRDGLLLAQDVTLTSRELTAVFTEAAKTGDQALILPKLMALVGTAWPEIQRDVEGLRD